MKDTDNALNEAWRIVLHRLAVVRRCAPDEIEVRITPDSEGNPSYTLYVKGEKVSETNAVDTMWLGR